MIRTSMHSLSSCLLACISIVGALVTIAPAYGTSITFELALEFSGATAPEGATPWLVATFDDGGTAGSVTLTMSAPNLILDTLSGDDEHVKNWNFNLDPALDPTSLVFSGPTTVNGAFGAITVDTDNTNANPDFMANGDGFFDIMFNFDIKNGPNKKFGLDDAVSFDISGIVGLDADSFDFLSFMDGGQGSFPTAAQVLGIGNLDESGWITVPEPTSGMLLLAGCFAGGLIAGRRKRR